MQKWTINSAQRAKVKKEQKILITDESGQILDGKVEAIYPIQENDNHYKTRVSVRKIAAVTTTLDGKIILQEISVQGYFYTKLRSK